MSIGVMVQILRGAFFAVVIMYILPVLSFAQQQKTDSLKACLPGETDLERADIFYELAYAYGELDYRLAATYCDQSFRFAKRSGDSLRIVKAARIKASIFRRLEQMDSSIRLGLEMLPIASRNHYHEEVKKILRGLALAYTYKGSYDLGMKYNFESLRMIEQDHDSKEQGFVLNNIGLIYYKIGNHSKARQYFLRALEVNAGTHEEPRIYLNLSLCCSYVRDFSNARKYLQKGFAHSQSNGQGTLAMEGLAASAIFHFLNASLDSAEMYYLRAYSLAKRMDSERFQLILTIGLAEVYLKRNEVSRAEQYLSEVKSLMQKTSFYHELTWLYYNLSELYKKTGDQRRRVLCQENYIHYKDSVYNRTVMNMAKIESEFQERSNKNKISGQEQLLELQEQVIRRQRVLNILSVVVAVLLMTLLYIFYRSNNRKKFVSQLLDRKIKERTEMLEASCLMTKRMVDERDAGVAKVLGDVKQQMATLSGLCVTGQRERSGSFTERYFRRIALVQKNVFEALDRRDKRNRRI